MTTSHAKAIRCESCGAALPVEKPTCDYCGSHHNLPVLPAAEKPTEIEPSARHRFDSRVILLAVVVVAGIFVLWLLSQ